MYVCVDLTCAKTNTRRHFWTFAVVKQVYCLTVQSLTRVCVCLFGMKMWISSRKALSVAGSSVFRLLWMLMFHVLSTLLLKATDEAAPWNRLRYLTPNVFILWLWVRKEIFKTFFLLMDACVSAPRTHSDLTLMFACVLTDSLSAQRVHTHGRRVRHSSSDSSGSDRSVESGSSSLRSRSPSQSPEVHPDPLLPANVHPACSSNKEVSARL